MRTYKVCHGVFKLACVECLVTARAEPPKQFYSKNARKKHSLTETGWRGVGFGANDAHVVGWGLALTRHMGGGGS